MDKVPRIGRWIFNRGRNNSIISAFGEYMRNQEKSSIYGSLDILYRKNKRTYVNLNDLRDYFSNVFCEDTSIEITPTPTLKLPSPDTLTPTPVLLPTQDEIPTTIDYKLLTKEQKRFLTTVVGEALSTSGFEIQACASTIMNRKKHKEWRAKSIESILVHSAFNAVAVGGEIFTNSTIYMDTGTWPGDTGKLNTKKFEI
jgi:hypothetical protein